MQHLETFCIQWFCSIQKFYLGEGAAFKILDSIQKLVWRRSLVHLKVFSLLIFPLKNLCIVNSAFWRADRYNLYWISEQVSGFSLEIFLSFHWNISEFLQFCIFLLLGYWKNFWVLLEICYCISVLEILKLPSFLHFLLLLDLFCYTSKKILLSSASLLSTVWKIKK